jgi:hypothetical protein
MGPLAAGASGCALVVLAGQFSRGACGGAAFRTLDAAVSAGPHAVLGSRRGPAGVVNLADSVEAPNWNEREVRQARHVTSLLARSPATVVPRSTRCLAIEVYTYSTSQAPLWCRCRLTTMSHLVGDAACRSFAPSRFRLFVMPCR